MAPLLKEKTEATTTAAESAASPAIPQGRTAADHLSADAVSLEVPVNIHGSRVTDVVRGVTPHTEPFEEQTTTMIVFPQGGVLRMATPVTAGQMLVLTNLKSHQDAICRVVKVRTYSSAASYVEVEFTHPQAGYWGVYFSSDGPELAKKATGNRLVFEAPELANEHKSLADIVQQPVPVASGARDQAINSSSRQTKDPSAPSTLGIPANRNESSFISIGSQEEVQLSATTTTFKSGSSATAFENQRPVNAPKKDQPAASPQARSIQETRETQLPADQGSTIESPITDRDKSQAATSGQNSGGTFGEAFGGSSLQATARATHNIGRESGVSASSPSLSQNWKLIAGGATLGVVLAAGAFFLFRPSANGKSAAKPLPAPIAEVQAAVTQPAESIATQATVGHSPAQTSQASPKNNLVAETKRSEPVVAPAVKTPKLEETPEVEPARPAPVARHNVPDVTSDLFGSLNAHPVSGRAADKGQTDSAPVVNSPAPSQLNGDGSPLTITASSAAPLPVPTQTIPGSPLQAGGAVPEPRLLTSALPVYPAAAKQTRTEGAVVLRTVIDEHGQVTDAQVVSGPTLLRQAAIDAVKHWKYEPSHVNGKPIAVQTLVTIHFRL